MGSSSSTPTRSVTIDNDSPVGVIDVSDAVVQRLKSGLPKGEAKKSKEHDSAPDTPPKDIPSTYPNPIPPPGSFVYAEPSLTSHEFAKKRDSELRENDQYWRRRLAAVEANYSKINSSLDHEYNATVESVKNQFERALPARREAKCVDFKDKVVKCLEAHSKEPLHCSSIVDEFVKCVNDSKN